MKPIEDLTAAEALRLHYARSRLPADGGRAGPQWTLIALGPLTLRLTNFEWRRRALPCHDLHHLLTGYPCTLTGEFEIAAWEFAAGRFPSALSTLFCLPLIGLGALATPARSFRAFVRGRRSRTLYGMPPDENLHASTLRELRERSLPRGEAVATAGDVIRYFVLAASSLALVAIPLLLLLAVSLNP